MSYKPDSTFQRNPDMFNRTGGPYYMNQNYSQPSEQKSKQSTSFSNVAPFQSPINYNQDLKQTNEKLQIKVRYLEDFIDNLNTLEKTQSIIDLKAFLKKNYRRFSMLLDEVYELREKNEQQSSSAMASFSRDGEITQLKATILQYQNKMDEQERQIQIKEQQISELKLNVRAPISEYGTLTKEQVQEQVQNLENTVRDLSNEVNELTEKNQKYRENLAKKDFFKEYDCMCKEVEGLRKQNQKLMDQLKGKEQQPSKQMNQNDTKFNFLQ